MIKFFRRIRHSLITETPPERNDSVRTGEKTTRYFKYAIGEIILVVIGILIALQINNWNEAQKVRALELKHLKELQSDILKTVEDVEKDLKVHRSALKSDSYIRDYFLETKIWHDSLAFHFHNTLRETQLYTKTSAFESLKSVGLDILSNDSLRIKLTDFFQIKAKDVSDKGRIEMGSNNIRNTLIPYYKRHFKPTREATKNTGQWFYYYNAQPPRKWVVLDKNKLLQDTELQLVIDETFLFRQGIRGGYFMLGKEGEALIKDINNEINRLQ